MLFHIYQYIGLMLVGMLYQHHYSKDKNCSWKSTLYIVPASLLWPLYLPYIWKNLL